MADTLGVSVRVGSTIDGSLRRGFRSVDRESRRMGSAIRDADRRADGLGRELDTLGRTLRESGDKSGRLERRIDRVGRAFDAAKRRSRDYRRELDRHRAGQAGAALGRARGRALGLAGAGYGAARLIGSALDVDEASVRLRTVLVTDDLERDLAAALAHARDVVRSGDTLHDETEILSVQYALSSAGLDANLARLGSTVASQVATATDGVPEATAEVLAGVYRNLGDTVAGDTGAERFANLGDILTHTQFRYSIRDFGQLGEAMDTVAAGARTMRVDAATTAVGLGILADAGLKGSEGGTAYRGVLLRMGKASDKLGFSVRRTADGTLDLDATLRGLGAALPGDIDARAAALVEAFGEEALPGVDAFLARLSTIPAEIDEARAATDDDTATSAFQLRADADSGAVKRLQRNVTVLGRVLAESAEVGGLADWGAESAAAVGKTIEESERLQTTIVGVGGAIGGVTAATLTWAAARFVLGHTRVMIRDITRLTLGAARATGVATAAERLYGATLGRTRLGGAIGRTRVGRRLGLGGSVVGGRGSVLRRGAGRAPGAARGAGGVLGRTTRLLGRLAPVARGVMTVVGAVVGLVSLKFIALGAIIGGAVYLVYKYWEPIKGFFGRVVGGIAARFRAGVDLLGSVLGSWRDVFTDFSWAGVGDALMRTLGAGIAAAGGLPLAAVRTVLGKVRDLLPFSDARDGPLRDITRSGASLLPTMGRGVSRAGPAGLRGPLARQLAAASVGLTLTAAVVPAAEAPDARLSQLRELLEELAVDATPVLQGSAAGAASVPAARTVNITNHITIQQLPGEDASDLVERILREIDRRRRRGALDDLDA